MTALADLQAAALEVLTTLGTTATYISVTASYSAGSTTETTATETVYCYMEEARSYAGMDTPRVVSGTLYVAASGMTATPKPSDRITYDSRTWGVTSVTPVSVEGGVALWQLAVAEQGSV